MLDWAILVIAVAIGVFAWAIVKAGSRRPPRMPSLTQHELTALLRRMERGA